MDLENAMGIGVSTKVTNCPRGRLMYYLDCVSSLLDLSDQYEISKLSNYEYSELLTETDMDILLSLCFVYTPDKLDKHVIFQDDDLCDSSLNKFYDCKALQNKYQVPDTIYIGQRIRKVFKIMTYKRKWLIRNWINPMQFYAERLERIMSNKSEGSQLFLDYKSEKVTYKIKK